jgi:hypothetical protein
MKTDLRHFLDKDDAAAGAPLERHQVRLEDTWDLTVLFPTPEDWTAAVRALQQDYPAIEQRRGKLGASAEALRDCLEFEKGVHGGQGEGQRRHRDGCFPI